MSNRRVWLGGQRLDLCPSPGGTELPLDAVGRRQLGAPSAEQIDVLGRMPRTLPAVEVCSAVLADVMGDEVGPGLAGLWRIAKVAHAGGQRHRVQHRLRLIDGVLQHSARRLGQRRVSERCRNGVDVIGIETAGGVFRTEPRARHGERGAGKGTQGCRCVGSRRAPPAPVGIDSDELVQRPCRRDSVAGRGDVCTDRSWLQVRGGGNGHAEIRSENGAVAMVGSAEERAPAAGGGHTAKATRVNASSRNSAPYIHGYSRVDSRPDGATTHIV